MTEQQAGIIRNELEITIDAPRAEVWRALIEDIDSWWQPDFYMTKEPRKIVLEASVGGRMYETSEDGSGLLWYNVVALEPNVSLTLAGFLAPPYAGPATTTMHLALEDQDGKTVFRMTEAVVGKTSEKLRNSLLEGWNVLFGDGLKAHVEALSTR